MKTEGPNSAVAYTGINTQTSDAWELLEAITQVIIGVSGSVLRYLSRVECPINAVPCLLLTYVRSVSLIWQHPSSPIPLRSNTDGYPE